MNRFRAAALGAAASVLAAVVPAHAADTPRLLTVSGHGEASGVPDQAQLSAGVTTTAKTAAEALAQNASQMNGVFAALKRLGIPERKIQTSNFSIQPQYPPYNQNNTGLQRIIGYTVSNQVSVTLDDVKKLGPAIDALVAAGANQINEVSFTIDDTKALVTKARVDAVADATDRANTYAKAAGVSLGSIVSISDAEIAISPPVPMMMKARNVAAEATPIAAGEESISANVTIVWEIR
jgi:uncharacterized protein YggE